MKTSLVFPLIRSAVSAALLASVAAAAAPKPKGGIRAILANRQNANGLFVTPVPVTVTGSLLWDGEHRSPNSVGPEGLQPAKAWEIHPIKQLVEC